jgi:hypothetical protein
MAADIRTGNSGIEAGQPHRLFVAPPNFAANIAVTRDGQRFLVAAPPLSLTALLDDSQPLTVVTNWPATLKQLGKQ